MNSSTDSQEHNEETVRFIQQLAYTDGKLRSPIDLNISYMKIVNLNPIQWFNYNVTPKKLKLTNTGYTVMLSAIWREEEPFLYGGPFLNSYVFSQLHFHWGKTDMEGSEHYIDGGSMPMELHAVHYKSEYGTQITALRQIDGIIILVYLFQLQAAPNPLLDDIINTLPFIKTAHSSIRLIPFPLTNIIQCFQHDYFVYWGSITMTNIRNSVLWLISREPLGISIDQVSYPIQRKHYSNIAAILSKYYFITVMFCAVGNVILIAEFRTLCDERKMPILTNRQPLQDRGNRNVFHVCPSGSRYATLLPIPRNIKNKYIREKNIGSNDKQ